MDWFWFAIAAPLLWGILNIIDKYILDKLVRDAYSYLIVVLLVEAALLPFFFLFTSISFDYMFVAIAIVVGLIKGLSYIIYNKAILVEEASRVATLL